MTSEEKEKSAVITLKVLLNQQKITPGESAHLMSVFICLWKIKGVENLSMKFSVLKHDLKFHNYLNSYRRVLILPRLEAFSPEFDTSLHIWVFLENS